MIECPKKPDAVYYFGNCLLDLIYPQGGMPGIQTDHQHIAQFIWQRISKNNT